MNERLTYRNFRPESKIRVWTERNITLQIAGENPHPHIKEISKQKLNLLDLRHKREREITAKKQESARLKRLKNRFLP